MRESRTYGSVRGALSNERPYRDREAQSSTVCTALRTFAHAIVLSVTHGENRRMRSVTRNDTARRFCPPYEPTLGRQRSKRRSIRRSKEVMATPAAAMMMMPTITLSV